jgi:anaerobic ribonucleoside-triphosphate reductase
MHPKFAEMEVCMNISKVKNENGMVGEGVKFERIRRITGYLVGTLDRFGDAKKSEVKERVKHVVK